MAGLLRGDGHGHHAAHPGRSHHVLRHDGPRAVFRRALCLGHHVHHRLVVHRDTPCGIARLVAVAPLARACGRRPGGRWRATSDGRQRCRHVAVDFGKGYAAGAGLETPRVTAQPRPVSPLNWMVFVEDGERLDYAVVRLAQGDAPAPLPTDAGFLARLAAPYLPLNHAIWVTTRRYGARRGGRESRAHGMAAAGVRVLTAGSPHTRSSTAWIGAIPTAASGSRTCASSRPGGRRFPFATACAGRAEVHGASTARKGTTRSHRCRDGPARRSDGDEDPLAGGVSCRSKSSACSPATRLTEDHFP